MSWGEAFFYYVCPSCGERFKYAADLIASLGGDFGLCPKCGTEGQYIKDGPRSEDDLLYTEAE